MFPHQVRRGEVLHCARDRGGVGRRALGDAGRLWCLRPVADGKEQAGKVRPASEILEIARKVMTLDPEEIPPDALRPETRMMLTPPVRILKEWRIWVLRDEVVTFSRYREGDRVTCRPEIDAEALAFAQDLARRTRAMRRPMSWISAASRPA
ncbi:ATP-grasp domain-containing protein [Rhodobacter capsulatus]|uniref:ATP-grasp domain-containing protein n=1 Tax=Rhodobacter capsulatus TaxID=1061 RepID=UPI004026F64E